MMGITLWGCPDSTKNSNIMGGDEGGGEIGGEVGGEIGGDAGGDMIPSICYEDLECPDDRYCATDLTGQGTCEIGCRADLCEGGRICNEETRECVFPPCGGDSDCPEGTYCSDEATCETGCRIDDACPDAFDDDGRAILCDPVSRECVSHSPCCVEASGEESCLAATAGQCEALGGQLIQSSLLCDDNPCGQTCELDVDCRNLDQGGATYYCDPTDQRCREGCREGECEGDLVCDTTSRLCSDLSCVSTSDCGEGQYCNPVDLICMTGCGVDDDCDGGYRCVSNRCIESCDPSDDQCGDGRYCDPQVQVCRESCVTHDDCADSEACNPVTAQCELGLCRDDEPLGELTGEPNSTFAEASRLNLVPLETDPDYSAGRAEGRIICGGDVDLYRVSLAQGERMRVTLSHEPSGDLNIRIFSANDTSTAQASANGIEIPEVIEYPLEGEIAEGQDYFIEISGALEADARVGYNLSVQTAPLGNACFFDPREAGAGDDGQGTATPLVQGGESAYDDGSICAGDEDWFSLPMTLNDGLIVEIRTSIASDALRFEVYDQSALNGIGGAGRPAFEVTLAESVEDVATGDRVYRLEVPFNSASFSDNTWYLAIMGDAPSSYANYRLQVNHEASGDACIADTQEPNNNFNEGVDIVDTFDLPTDNLGLLAQGQDNRVLGMSICSGDVDFYCFDLAEGDKVEAWVISDNTIGSLEVRLVDNEGGTVGYEATHTLTGEDFDYATFLGARSARYCAVVDGLGNAQGDYQLNIRRTVPVGGVCGEDENGGRNDSSGSATPLTDISGDQGLRFEFRNGLMCGVNDRADWYTFPVAEEGSFICAMLEGFDHDPIRGGLDLELYAPSTTPADLCVSDQDCGGNGRCVGGACICASDSECQDGSCIDDRCQVPASDSTYIYDFEMLSQERLFVTSGAHLLKVYADGTQSELAYDLRVTVTPRDQVCAQDWQEAGDPNDNSAANGFENSQATILGSGSIGLCDAWLCDDGDQDWYRVTVPAQQDRTIFIEFDRNGDGPLELWYYGQTELSLGEDFIRISDLGENYQCINIRGGEADLDVELGVLPKLRFEDDGDSQIDYSLRVVPTDLNANPQGECARFNSGASSYSSCAESSNLVDFLDMCFPSVSLP